ncbi:IS30 family transposase [Roseibium sp.]|uniref:IS30 family transposase n=1 Tax=Roseibium sp. TaxID=1936156 RepID=UPI0026145901|nr:IS30 family transposase [Roseibium sp.]
MALFGRRPRARCRVPPGPSDRNGSRRHVYRLLGQKFSRSEATRRLGRDRATISREIKRNYWHDSEFADADADGYRAMTASEMARDRRRRIGKLHRRRDLRTAVIAKLRDGWSPEQIAGRLKIEPSAKIGICHETIYRYVYSPEGQQQKLARFLPERRRKRRPRYARKPQNAIFPVERSINFRPESVNDRKEFGHWEADLMIFQRSHGDANVATVVERTSRFDELFKNNDQQSKPIMDRLINVLGHARQSLTFDCGFEFASWRKLRTGMGFEVWLCDPSAPWRKGAVEKRLSISASQKLERGQPFRHFRSRNWTVFSQTTLRNFPARPVPRMQNISGQ